MRTLFRILTCYAAVAASVFTAGVALAADKVELKLFHRWPNDPFKSYVASVVKDFEAAHPDISISVEQVLNDAYKDKIRILMGSASLPDVFFSWSGEFAKNLVRSGRIMDLTPVMEENKEWAESLAPGQSTPFTFDGKQYGVPWQMDGKVMYYNKDLFAQAGVELPKRFEDIIATCKTFQEEAITPILFGSRAAWAVSHYIGTLNERMVDPAVLAKDYDPATGEFTDPMYVAALEKFAELSKCMNPTPNGIDHQAARAGFAGGRGAMMYMSFVELPFLKDVKFDYDFALFPKVEGGKGRVNTMLGGAQGFMVSAETKHPKEAVEFLKFLISPKMGARFTEMTGSISTVVGAMDNFDATQKQREGMAMMVEAKDPYLWLDTAVDAGIAEAYMRGGQLILDGKMTPAEVIADVQAAAKRAREKN